MDKNEKNKKEYKLTDKRVSVISFLAMFIAFMIIGSVSHNQEKESVIENFRQTADQIYNSIIDEIHYQSFEDIDSPADMELEEYKDLQKRLNILRSATDAEYLYTAKMAEDGTYIYVIDGQPLYTNEFSAPGTPIKQELYEYMENSLKGKAMISDDFLDTNDGTICTAYYPIFKESREIYGVLCMEFDMNDQVRGLRRDYIVFLIIAFIISLILTVPVTLIYRDEKLLQNTIRSENKDTSLILNQIVDSLSVGLSAYRLHGHEMILFNEESKRIFELEGEVTSEIFNNYIEEHIMPENGDAVRNAVAQLKNPGDGARYSFKIKHKNGDVLIIETYTRLLQFSDGSLFILSSMQDRTEQRNLISLLSQERKQYRDALTHNCEYTFYFDATSDTMSGEFVSANGSNIIKKLNLTSPVSFTEMCSLWAEREKPKLRDEKMKKYLESYTFVDLYKKGERSVEWEYYIPHEDKYIRVTVLLSKSERNKHILAFVLATDITQMRKEEELKRQELLNAKKAIEDAYETANRASAAKSSFLSNMSHDIRTPMNAIIGMTAIAGAHLDDKERVADCLNKITTSSKHLLGLINEVLDMSKIESGKLDLNEENFNLSQLIDDILVVIKPQVEAKNHELEVLIKGVEHEKLTGDSQRISQIFMNLLSNAIKYTHDGGKIKLAISELPTNKKKIGCYEFVVEDNGIGMSKEFLERLFEPFERASDVVAEKIHGTGLGMPITKNIVQMMNGNIQVESEKGKGTKFTVTVFLKLQEVDESALAKELIDLPVLVTDDDKIACETVCEILDELGMKSEYVLSGSEAVERVVEHHEKDNDFFAAIIDWKMPDMDGVETTRAIRQKVGDKVPIIIISAYDWSAIEPEARAAGANAFISKPLFKSRLSHVFCELKGEDRGGDNANAFNALLEKDFSGKRALLAEDNDINAEIAKEIFDMVGIEIERVENGQEAVKVIAEAEGEPYDVIFMDIQMPVMDGYGATRAIRALESEYAKKVPIIAMTANAFSDDVRAAKAAGMNAHLSKPINFEQLKKTLETWL